MRSNAGVMMLALGTFGCYAGAPGASAEGGVTGSSGIPDVLTGTTPTSTGEAVTGEGESEGVLKFDLAMPDFGAPECGMGNGDPDFSYIWIANSTQGTISKIETVTLKERGRYVVRPDAAGSPSRTSVNLAGDVAVANRYGGLTKVHARPDRCGDSNGAPGLQTASDAAFLAWGEEECVAWYTPMAYVSQRPVAWTQGSFNPAACRWEDQKVWTSGMNTPGTVDIVRVNGDTGTIEATVTIGGVAADNYGIYGGAVDAKGNFWGSQLGIGKLVFVDYQTLEFKTWDMVAGGYGMTVDSKGYVWTCSSQAARFDPMTEQWQVVNAGGSGGCMEDGAGTLYMSGGAGDIVALDTETLTVKKNYPVPQYVHGISIDFYGYVWGVSMGTQAYRVQPIDGTLLTFEGLVGAYTYSDMTGFALSNVGTPSG